MSGIEPAQLRAPIDRMIAAGRAGAPEVTAAADPLILQFAAAGYANEAVWLLRDSLVPSPRQAWDALARLTAHGRGDYLRWHREVVDSLVSSLIAFDGTLRTHFGVEADDLTTVIADTILWRRGLALRAERLGQRLARRDPDRRERIIAFHEFRRQYAAWTMYLPSDAEQAGQHTTKVFAEEVWQRPEYDELWQAAYGDLTYDQYVEELGEPLTADVLAALPEGACLVEYWWYLRSDAAGSRREYLALRLRNDLSPELAIAGLGPAGPTDALVAELFGRATSRGARGQLLRDLEAVDADPDPSRFVEGAGRLRALVVDPLDVVDPAPARLIIVPDGPLTRVSFAALPTGPGAYLLDSHVVSYLQSAVDVIPTSAGSPIDATEPLVIGEPDFDLAPGRTATVRVWGELAGTRIEAEQVAEQLGVPPVTGADATVDRLLATRSPRVLHLATHGGMLPADIEVVAVDPRAPDHDPALVDATATYVFADIGFLSGRRVPYQELRSVIALAGANAWLGSGELGTSTGTGHVNAEDLLDLDLSATELVVLSACDTGRGILHLEEGVVGLRSSLRLAGAGAIVCALWPVPDLETADLMADLYRAPAGHTHPEALRRAQLAIRERHPDQPVLWGAFICEERSPAGVA